MYLELKTIQSYEKETYGKCTYTIKRFMDVEHKINIKNKMKEKQDTA